MTNFKPIDENTPKDRLILVPAESGTVYTVDWVLNTITGDVEWSVVTMDDGKKLIVVNPEC